MPYDAPQAWSRAIHSNPAGYDGIAFLARHDDEALCYAIYDRATDAIRHVGGATDLDKEDWFWRLAELYDVGLAPDTPPELQ